MLRNLVPSKIIIRFAQPILIAAWAVAFAQVPPMHAETGAKAWLRYARLDEHASRTYDELPSAVVTLGDSAILASAQQELLRGLHGILGKNLRIESTIQNDPALVLGKLPDV